MNKAQKENLKRIHAEIVELVDSGARVAVKQKLNNAYDVAKSISKPETEIQFRPDPEDRAIIANQKQKLQQLEQQDSGLRFRLAEAERKSRAPIAAAEVEHFVGTAGRRLMESMKVAFESSADEGVNFGDQAGRWLLCEALNFYDVVWRSENLVVDDFPDDRKIEIAASVSNHIIQLFEIMHGRAEEPDNLCDKFVHALAPIIVAAEPEPEEIQRALANMLIFSIVVRHGVDGRTGRKIHKRIHNVLDQILNKVDPQDE